MADDSDAARRDRIIAEANELRLHAAELRAVLADMYEMMLYDATFPRKDSAAAVDLTMGRAKTILSRRMP